MTNIIPPDGEDVPLSKREIRSLRDKEYYRRKRASETPEERKIRQTKQSKYWKRRQASEAPKDRKPRLIKRNELARKKYHGLSPEERKVLSQRKKENYKKRIALETPDEREIRLQKRREYSIKRRIFKSSLEGVIQIQKKREDETIIYPSETLEERKIRLQILREKWEQKDKLKLPKERAREILGKINRNTPIPRQIIVETIEFFDQHCNSDIIKRRPLDVVVAFCLMNILKNHNRMILSRDIVKYWGNILNIPISSINKQFYKLKKEIPIVNKVFTPFQILKNSNYMEKLNPKYQPKIIELFKMIENYPLRMVGKDPLGWIGAVVYTVYKNEGKKISQENIALLFRITQVTLRKRLKDLEELDTLYHQTATS